MSLVYYDNTECDNNKRLRIRIRQCAGNHEEQVKNARLLLPTVPTADLLGPLPGDAFYGLKNYDVNLLQPTRAPVPMPIRDFTVPIDMNVEEIVVAPRVVTDRREDFPSDDIIVSQGFVPDQGLMAPPRPILGNSPTTPTIDLNIMPGYTTTDANAEQLMSPPSYTQTDIPRGLIDTNIDYVYQPDDLYFYPVSQGVEYVPTAPVYRRPISPSSTPSPRSRATSKSSSPTKSYDFSFDNEERRQEAQDFILKNIPPVSPKKTKKASTKTTTKSSKSKGKKIDYVYIPADTEEAIEDLKKVMELSKKQSPNDENLPSSSKGSGKKILKKAGQGLLDKIIAKIAPKTFARKMKDRPSETYRGLVDETMKDVKKLKIPIEKITAKDVAKIVNEKYLKGEKPKPKKKEEPSAMTKTKSMPPPAPTVKMASGTKSTKGTKGTSKLSKYTKKHKKTTKKSSK